jgi:hypothetical protein
MTDLDARLDNWKQCLKDRPHYKRAMSLEGNYKEPPVTKEMLDILVKQGEVFEKTAAARLSPNEIDALAIERAVISLPEKHRKVIVHEYMYPHKLHNDWFYKTCKTIGIGRSHDVFNEYLHQSKKMLCNLLHFNETKRILS